MKKTDLAYMAGIIDGEGCIRIGRIQSPYCKRPFDHRATIQIGMTSQPVLLWVHHNFGGCLGVGRNESVRTKKTYQWSISAQQGTKLIKSLYKYLIEKKYQAKLFVEFAKTIGKKRNKQNYITDKIWNRRCVMFESMQKLNKKGPDNE